MATISLLEVLRRPLELSLDAPVAMVHKRLRGVVLSLADGLLERVQGQITS